MFSKLSQISLDSSSSPPCPVAPPCPVDPSFLAVVVFSFGILPAVIAPPSTCEEGKVEVLDVGGEGVEWAMGVLEHAGMGTAVAFEAKTGDFFGTITTPLPLTPGAELAQELA